MCGRDVSIKIVFFSKYLSQGPECVPLFTTVEVGSVKCEIQNLYEYDILLTVGDGGIFAGGWGDANLQSRRSAILRIYHSSPQDSRATPIGNTE